MGDNILPSYLGGCVESLFGGGQDLNIHYDDPRDTGEFKKLEDGQKVRVMRFMLNKNSFAMLRREILMRWR